ncbi:DUF4302 domain-containing protein [Sphingobacterium rhinopitheci]|uniref:DUF4302 domain-containing protein n=1 Tax=Sphingobacterium rhinopitheci TaxID=2781960 RepID=UPI001F522B2C|nr:DUF4302 domain-containing protein [Sphingobacterium rhinopitheci]MCI0920450.1 DUF4302 domain-containing protein [Sphingobacterium rhinopitheci]
MRRIRILIIAIVSLQLFYGCNKFQDFPDTSVDERINERMELYAEYLTDAPFGWKAYLLTKSGLQKNFTFRFNNVNRVFTILEDDVTEMDESSYRLKYLQRPTLIFDTYSLLHLLADPDDGVYGGVVAEGMRSDFEFHFLEATADRIELKGIYNESKLILIKATSVLDASNTFNDTDALLSEVSNLRTYFKRTLIDGVEYEVDLNTADRRFGLVRYEGGIAVRSSSSFYIVGDEINFYEPIVLGLDTIHKLTDVVFDPTGFLSAKLGSVNLRITEAIEPLFYDVTVISRFWASDRQLFFSSWTRDGVKDYLNESSVATLTGFNQQIFWMGFNTGYDLLGYAQSFSLAYGVAIGYNLDFTTGIIKYSYLGFLGSMAAGPRAITLQAAQNFTDPNGLYIIEKGASVYDLVTVTDARKWISITPI